jgi:hypothetical protein
MSLLSSASLWVNEDQNKKRKPSMNRQPQPQSQILSADSILDTITDYKEEFTELQNNTGSNYNPLPDDRSSNINNIINKITSISIDNDGNKLANFKPLSNPNITINKPDQSSRNIGDELISPEVVLKDTLMRNNNSRGNFTANGSDNTNYGNYSNSYNGSALQQQQQQPTNNQMDNRLLEKINYMIKLLEEQKKEKTSNITEEFILYTFLGVFMIFIVDSFSRSGKYVR